MKREGKDKEGDWLGDALQQHALPEARAQYRQELRKKFLAGELSASKTSEAFRSNLRERFVEGRLRRKSNRLRVLRYLLPVAAAAVLMLTLLETGIGEDRRWELLEVAPDVSVIGEITDWQEIHTGQDRLRLGYGSDVFIEIGARSRVERLVGGGRETLNARQGSLVFTALEGEDPIAFLIETPDVVIEISSNSVGIDIYEGGTCVCVLAGEVSVTPRVGESEVFTIGSGCSCFIESDGNLHSKEELEDSHARPIQALVEFSDL